jgi:hypothetical protein
MDNRWLMQEIGMGLSKLLCLRLDGSPSEDMIEGTVAAWLEALTHNRVWDEQRDVPRIRESFKRLARTLERWPAPVKLTENLPDVETKLALPAKVVSDEVAKANIAECMRLLYGPVDSDGSP